jgi:hypothetical protein
MTANHHPDGLTIDVITALQREVDDELRREGYPVQQGKPTFAAVRPAPARRRRGGHSSPRTGGSPRQGAGLPPTEVTAPGVARAGDDSAARSPSPEARDPTFRLYLHSSQRVQLRFALDWHTRLLATLTSSAPAEHQSAVAPSVLLSNLAVSDLGERRRIRLVGSTNREPLERLEHRTELASRRAA